MLGFRIVIVAALAVAAAPSLTAQAQGIPSGARRGPINSRAPRLMVANPSANASADSAVSVEIARGARKEMERVVGRDYAVVPDSIMNQALVQYGYPENAILSPSLATTLAKQIPGTRVIVTSTMTKAQDGRYQVAARVTGLNDDAGYLVRVDQAAGQNFTDLGKNVAQGVGPGVKALDDAKQCMDNRSQKPDKAVEAAQAALKDAPQHGLAHYCLALMAIDQKKSREEVVQHLQEATKGDNMSLAAYSMLAEQYQAANDTANTVRVFSDLLRVAPTNQKLRENIFRYLLQAGKPEVAEAVADSGLRIDPFNADLYDLKSNACLFQGNYRCAIEALEQAYAIDSTKADSLFFVKITATAEQRLSDSVPPPTAADTATFARWAEAGVRKFPNNVSLLETLVKGYSYTGQTDSALAVTRRLMAADSTNVVPALAAVQSLALAKRLPEAEPFITFVQQRGDADHKDRLAGIFVQAASQHLPAKEFKEAADLARRSTQFAAPTGPYATPAHFVLGVATFQQAAALDAEVERQKSCELARQEDALFKEARDVLPKGRATRPETADQLLGYIPQFVKRTESMVKAYCK